MGNEKIVLDSKYQGKQLVTVIGPRLFRLPVTCGASVSTMTWLMSLRRWSGISKTPAILILVWFASVIVAHAASFDCTKAQTQVERLICTTPRLSALDAALGAAYQGALQRADDAKKRRLLAEQRQWLKSVRNVCTDEACILQAYTSRARVLGADIEPRGEQPSSPPVGLAPTTGSTPMEEVQQLFGWQRQKLRDFQQRARDVVYLGRGFPTDDTGFCGRFWKALATGQVQNVPSPAVVAQRPDEKEKLSETLHDLAKGNFNRFLSQGGKLSPDKYIDIDGSPWRLGPLTKKGADIMKDLPPRFNRAWQRDGLLDQDELLDSSSTHLMYQQPFPIPGYVRPLLITLARDRCDGCTGLSMGIRFITVDGLPNPEWSRGKYPSASRYSDAEKQAERRRDLKPAGPYVLLGLAGFDDRLIFWSLKQQSRVEPSAREIAEDVHYINPGDLKLYLRNFELDVALLDEPGYRAIHTVCSIGFN